MTKAEIICDSVTPFGNRITSVVVQFPRFILAEVNTHRVFSRSYASSRAIPTKEYHRRVKQEGFTPSYWGIEQRGMQASKQLEAIHIQEASSLWKGAKGQALSYAQRLITHFHIHKQIANRLLEPFAYVTGIITSTEWDNFFKLRLHPDAQPEFRELAEAIETCFRTSTPQELGREGWHLPFITIDTRKEVRAAILSRPGAASIYPSLQEVELELLKKISVARCARVSYGINERLTTRAIEDDLALYKLLLTSGHWSPMEHQAKSMKEAESPSWEMVAADWEPGITHADRQERYWSGNFRGLIQNRQLLEL